MHRINIDINNNSPFSIVKFRRRIRITDEGIKPIDEKGKVVKFTKPLTENLFKIYIIKRDTDIIYIGKAVTSISQRFKYGFSQAIKNESAVSGYHGYKWITDSQNKEFDLTVFVISNFPQEDELRNMFKQPDIYKNRDKKKLEDDFIEGIEAELVYHVRNELNLWPLYQHEIHFHNGDEIKRIAQKLYKELND